MHPEYIDLIERRFKVLPEKGPDKRLSLSEAVATHTRPGMSIHFASTHNRPYLLAFELLRRFDGEDAALTLSCQNMGEAFVPFYLGKILRHAITSFAGDVFPYPAPNPIINEAWSTGRVTIEHWSILSNLQRLLAGALRLPFMPTRSLVDSSMAEENASAFCVTDDPFGSREKVGLVSPFRPDICFIHVPACDVAGNAIISAPYGEGPIPVFAAIEGAVVSTERIVSTEYLRQHSDLVRIPSHLVKAVVELPFGGFPRGQTNVGLPDCDAYADDYAFQYELRLASRQGEQAVREWTDRWILSSRSPGDFLKKVGKSRLEKLRARARPEAWSKEVEAVAAGATGDNARPGELDPSLDTVRASEMMVAVASRKIADLARELGLNTMLAGIGAANLAAWIATQRLREEGHAIESMAEVGYFGYEPRPADPYVFSYRNTPTCIATTDILTVLGLVVGGDGNLGSLGAAQVDRFGNLNTTMIPGKMHLLGSGGGNDVASGSKACVVTAYLGKGKFKERVDYVTSPGKNVRLVVTDRCVFEKAQGRSELELTGYFAAGPAGFDNAESAVREIRAAVEWDLMVRDDLEAIGGATLDEVLLMRAFDPYRQFLR